MFVQLAGWLNLLGIFQQADWAIFSSGPDLVSPNYYIPIEGYFNLSFFHARSHFYTRILTNLIATFLDF